MYKRLFTLSTTIESVFVETSLWIVIGIPTEISFFKFSFSWGVLSTIEDKYTVILFVASFSDIENSFDNIWRIKFTSVVFLNNSRISIVCSSYSLKLLTRFILITIFLLLTSNSGSIIENISLIPFMRYILNPSGVIGIFSIYCKFTIWCFLISIKSPIKYPNWLKNIFISLITETTSIRKIKFHSSIVNSVQPFCSTNDASIRISPLCNNCIYISIFLVWMLLCVVGFSTIIRPFSSIFIIEVI